MSDVTTDPAAGYADTGTAGFDDILGGGLSRGNVFLVEGRPGTGKTTLGLQFLRAGHAVGERVLYVTLCETRRELEITMARHGWDVPDDFGIFEVTPPDQLLDSDQQQSLLYSSDLELGETTRAILAEFERVRPTRVVLDSLAEIRLLAQGPLRFRRQLLSLKHYFAQHEATVLILDDKTGDPADAAVHSIVHGVIQLEERWPEYGGERRRLRISKYRGQAYRGGYHDFIIRKGGVETFPRLVATEERHRANFSRDRHTSGIAALDALLGGGIEQGSSTLVMGPSGTGKTTFTVQFVLAAIARGEKAACFMFDEELGLLCSRMREVDIDLYALRAAGSLHLAQVDAAELSPGEFAHRVKRAVDELGAKTVVIDSLNGYQTGMVDKTQLTLHLHELLQYLNRRGINTFLTIAQHGLVGDMKTPVDVTYISDTVVLLRYFEAAGCVRRAVSVIKKRSGAHEQTIREYRVTPRGLELGEPLHEFQGVLRGVPEFIGGGGRGQPLLLATPAASGREPGTAGP